MIGEHFITAARAGLNGVWRFVAVFGLVMLLWILGSSCFLTVGMFASGSFTLTTMNPYALFVLQLVGFAFIPLGLWLGLRIIHHRPFFTLIDPSGHFQQRKFWFGAVVWFGLSALGDVVLSFLQPSNYQFTFHLEPFLLYLVLAVVFIPIQASSEELLFRGYLTQGFGLIRWWLGWIIPAVLFGLMHSLNPEVDTYGMLLSMPIYIGVGLLFGWVTLRSNSLEMSMGMHIANNLYSSLIVTFPSSALTTETLFRIQKYDPILSLVVFFASALVFVLLFELSRRKAWRISSWASLLLVVSLLVSGCQPIQAVLFPSTPSPQVVGTGTPEPLSTALKLEDCPLDTPGSGGQEKALCGQYEVLENRDQPDGRKISLHVVVLKAVSRSPEPDPVFLLAGGPGQAASEFFLYLLNSLDRVRQKHDLVMLDQRGTGELNPLKCKQTVETPDVITADIPLEEQLKELDACLVDLKKENDLDLIYHAGCLARPG